MYYHTSIAILAAPAVPLFVPVRVMIVEQPPTARPIAGRTLPESRRIRPMRWSTEPPLRGPGRARQPTPSWRRFKPPGRSRP
jgi:hypothetical protein